MAIEGEFTDVEWGPDPIARTNAEFSFSLASTTTIRIQGDIQVAPQADPWESWVYVWFAGVLGHRIGSIVGGGPGPAIFFDEIVTLPAGTYSFFVDAAAQGYFPGPAASWNVLITVPEPALLPVFALLALWMRRARSSVQRDHRRRFARSTPPRRWSEPPGESPTPPMRAVLARPPPAC